MTAALQEARSSTTVSLRFRTGRGDALLLVAAGRTDYLLMLLEAGLLKVRPLAPSTERRGLEGRLS